MKKTNNRKELNSRIYRFLIFGLMLMMGYSLFKNILRVKRAKNTVEKARMRLEKIKQENLELGVKLKLIQGDAFIEKQLRDSLGLVKEGEIVVILPDDEILKSLAPKAIEEEEIAPEPNWKKWLNLFL